jgi:hypothetical protein
MAKIKRIIPFGWWPANWGLTGTRRAVAEAEYYWEGEDLAYRLLDIDHEDKDSKEYRTDKLRLDYRYHKIGEFDYGLGLLENDIKLTESEREREIAKYLNRYGRITAEEMEYKLFELSFEVKDTEAYRREKLKLDVRFGKKTEEEADHELLDLQFDDKTSIDYQVKRLGLELKWGNITENQHDKEVATLLREPWFNVVGADQRIQGENVQMAVELDWNEYFVQFLESKGWEGRSPDEIVDKWFESAMRQMLDIEEMGGIDDGSADPMPLAGSHRFKRDDGLTEYR